jgi:hypothetical protein
MSHRYGRHGPHAWLRWYKRNHAQSASRLPVPVVPAVVIYIRILSSSERIITIVQQPEGYDERDEGNTPLPFPDQKLLGSSEEGEPQASINAYLKKNGEFEAGTRYDSDKQNVLDRGGEWPLEKAIEREASIKANVALRPLVNKLSFDIDEAKRLYIKIYINAYRARYESDTHNGTLPNEEMRRVQSAAQQDASNDKQDDIHLSETELTYQAVIRIHEIFGYETRARSRYLTYIMGYLPCYKEAYQKDIYPKEQDRPTRSAPFPSSWQPGR